MIPLKTLNAQFPEPEPENEPGLFKFFSTYQIHSVQKYVKNITKVNAAFRMDTSFTFKTIIVEKFEGGKDTDQKNEILLLRKTLIKNLKIYIDNNLNPVKKDIIDSRIKVFFNH